MKKRFRAWGYTSGADMAWVAAHPCMTIACIALAPVIGNIPERMVAGILTALGPFFFFSEGVRRAAWRRQIFSADPRPPRGAAAVGSFMALAPAFMIIIGAWTAYGLMSWRVLIAAVLGMAYMACAITAAEAAVASAVTWRPWIFNMICLALQPMLLFGPLFRPDAIAAPGLYRLSLWNPVVPGIEVVRAGVFGVPLSNMSAFYAWLAVFAVIVLSCGGRDRLRRGQHRH